MAYLTPAAAIHPPPVPFPSDLPLADMTYKLDARVTTLGNLLHPPRLFDVPAFQRAYSWTTDEAGQLLEDLLLAIAEADAGQSEGGYFLSPILLLRNDEQGSARNATADRGRRLGVRSIRSSTANSASRR